MNYSYNCSICRVITLNDTTWPVTESLTNNKTYTVKFEPIINTTGMVQHIILHECTTNVSLNGTICPNPNGGCDRVAYAWGPVSAIH